MLFPLHRLLFPLHRVLFPLQSTLGERAKCSFLCRTLCRAQGVLFPLALQRKEKCSFLSSAEHRVHKKRGAGPINALEGHPGFTFTAVSDLLKNSSLPEAVSFFFFLCQQLEPAPSLSPRACQMQAKR